MGALSRFGEIMSANVNSWMDNLEARNAGPLIDERLRKTREELAEVQKQTADIIANRTAAKRRLDEAQAEVDKYKKAAENAIIAGNDDDARRLLELKQQKEAPLASLRQNYDMADAEAKRAEQMFNKLRDDIVTMETRASALKGKLATAKARESMNRVAKNVRPGAATARFDSLEDNINRRLDRAEAMEALNDGTSEGEDLLKQYSQGAPTAVDDELAAMKAKLLGGGA